MVSREIACRSCGLKNGSSRAYLTRNARTTPAVASIPSARCAGGDGSGRCRLCQRPHIAGHGSRHCCLYGFRPYQRRRSPLSDVLRDLPQQQVQDRRARAGYLGCEPRGRSRGAVGKGRHETAHRRDAAAGAASAGCRVGSRRRGAIGARAGRRSGGQATSRRCARSPPESQRIHERDSRSARSRDRRTRVAAIRRSRSGRIRQRRERALDFTGVAGELPVRCANCEPHGGRRSVASPGD